MSLNLEQKQAVVAEIAERVKTAQAIVLAEYRGLEVGDMTKLRAKARAAGVYLRVRKNSLARRAGADTPFAGLSDKMVGPLAYGISVDPVAVAKLLSEFSKANDKFVIKGGALPGSAMSVKDVANLASLPSREVLLSRVVGTIQAPISGFVQVLAGTLRKMVTVIDAIAKQKGNS